MGQKIQYFGIIEEIWELDYGRDNGGPVSMPLDQTIPTERDRIEEEKLVTSFSHRLKREITLIHH